MNTQFYKNSPVWKVNRKYHYYGRWYRVLHNGDHCFQVTYGQKLTVVRWRSILPQIITCFHRTDFTAMVSQRTWTAVCICRHSKIRRYNFLPCYCIHWKRIIWICNFGTLEGVCNRYLILIALLWGNLWWTQWASILNIQPFFETGCVEEMTAWRHNCSFHLHVTYGTNIMWIWFKLIRVCRWQGKNFACCFTSKQKTLPTRLQP